MDKLIELAKCTRPHGIKGGFLIHLFNEGSRFLQKGKKVRIYSDAYPEGREMELESIQYGNKAIGYFKEVSDRNDIETLLPFTIQVPRSEFEEPEEGEFYLSDLVGLKVYDDSTEELIGEVRSFYDNGAQDVMTIALRRGGVLEIPFVDAFVPEVDMEEKKIFVVVPEVIE